MRLNEIDHQDRLWAAMVELDLDIDRSAAKATKQLRILVKMKNPAFNKLWLPTIDKTLQELRVIINANFANDDSTNILKSKASRYLQEIENLKSQL